MQISATSRRRARSCSTCSDWHPANVLIDFGSGTGTFAIASARRCVRVHVVDVSQAMIDHAKAKANTAGISNLVFSHVGFLTYEHLDEPAATIAVTFALHHLPDL
jgi:Methylase involved in ubiquinone/menaquinone biosynthesis